MTACINPNKMAYTALQDWSVRRKQYCEALDYYLHATDYPIVFVENSGEDISPDYTEWIRKGRLEILTFEGNDFPRHLGKGYGEGIIVDYAISHSVSIRLGGG